MQKQYYFIHWDNYIQIFVFIGTIAFVYDGSSACKCMSSSTWQLGAIVLALACLNFIIMLRCLPYIGEPINLLILIIKNYIQLIYLPGLLIMSFGIPFYMLFVRDEESVVCVLN